MPKNGTSAPPAGTGIVEVDISLSYFTALFGESMLRCNPGALYSPSPRANKLACGSVLTCPCGNQNGLFSVSAWTASKAGFKRSS
jgi:hypothetical protein